MYLLEILSRIVYEESDRMEHSSLQITCDIFWKTNTHRQTSQYKAPWFKAAFYTTVAPFKIEKAQLFNIAPENAYVVPKTRLELVQAYAR